MDRFLKRIRKKGKEKKDGPSGASSSAEDDDGGGAIGGTPSRPGSPVPVRTSGGKRVAVDTESRSSELPVTLAPSDSEPDPGPETGAPATLPLCETDDIWKFAEKKGLLSPVEITAGLKLPASTLQRKDPYPRNDKNLQFQGNWLDRWSWVVYSKEKDAAFCRFCVLFVAGRQPRQGRTELKRLVTEPYKDWKRATEDFKAHSSFSYHKEALIDATSFQRQAGRQSDVRRDLDKAYAQEQDAKKKNLLKLMKLVAVMGQQEIASRGSFETVDWDKIETGPNPGNMNALIGLLRFVDQEFRATMDKSHSKGKYTSHGIHDEIRHILGQQIKTNIVKTIHESGGIFGLIADGTTDVNGVEQLCICVRYLEISMQPRERFLAFIPLSDRGAEHTANAILDELAGAGLDLNKMVAQTFDGASVMTGSISGVKTRILGKYPMCTFTHCASHSFNLALMDSNKIISLCIQCVNKTITFIQSSDQRKRILDQVDGASKQRLMKYCQTRFVQRFEAISRFADHLQAINMALEVLATGNFSSDTRSAAEGHLALLQRFDVIFGILLLQSVAPDFKSVATALQSKTLDLLGAVEMVASAATLLEAKAVDHQEFEKVYKEAKNIAVGLGCNEDFPRGNRGRHKRTAEEWYYDEVWEDYHNSLAANLKTRFGKHQQSVFAVQRLIPHFAVDSDLAFLAKTVAFYQPIHQRPNSDTEAEVKLWKAHWERARDSRPDEGLPETAFEALKACDCSFFPGIYACLKIFLTLPATSCSAKRSFSGMARIKDYKSNRMGTERLEDTAHLSFNRDIALDYSKAVDTFVSAKNRRGL